MLTLKGSLVGITAFVICIVLYLMTQVSLRRHVGIDFITMYHNRLPGWRDPFFWVVLIVFMAGGSLIFRR
jgi:hypothetical protein